MAFDPQVDLGPLVVRWQALALVAIILGALGLWWLMLRRNGLLPATEDLFFVVLGIATGALIGGRLIHGLVFLEAYATSPETLLHLDRGSFSLLGAVAGGSLSGAYVCRLLGHGAARWADAAAIPLLLLVGLGKLAMLLAGGGQGVPFDGAWAVAFAGLGPWLSPDPGVPAHPAQVYEGAWAVAGVVLLLVLPRGRWAHPGVPAVFLMAVAWWLAGRFLAAFLWRDEVLALGLRGEQLAALAGLVVILVTWLLARPKVPAE